MTAEQLEELLGKVTPGEWRATRDECHFGSLSEVIGGEETRRSGLSHQLMISVGGWCALSEQEANTTIIALAPSLASRVICAEKLVEALEVMRDTTNRAGMYDYADAAITAYREASK